MRFLRLRFVGFSSGVHHIWFSPEHQPGELNSLLWHSNHSNNLPVNSLNSQARARLDLLTLAMPGQHVTIVLTSISGEVVFYRLINSNVMYFSHISSLHHQKVICFCIACLFWYLFFLCY
ncbi:hypothetical protein E2C01_048766 [Portunus trituberculatus]|uniref:Uncharacterized protein n=1 Tax=Portunus trituberculatus TaxID=210409 RepID=A0A5B7GBV3_PORTR|nr:hypothetical protein [Portunus trituberculatus]